MNIFKKIGRRSSGFTLIELLVVIAIIAILAVVVVLTLNPGQLLMQARDSNRVSDLATVKSAIGYYLEDVVTSTAGTGSAVSLTCYEDGPTYNGASATSSCPWFAGAASTTVISTSSRVTSVNTSWIPINLSLISVGSPLGQWPVDPVNTLGHASNGTNVGTTDHFYSFAASSTVTGGFKLGVKMESTKYSNGGTGDVESTDGGTNPYAYEAGANLTL